MTLLNHAYHLRFKTHPKPFLEIQRRSFLHFLNQGLNDEFCLYKTMTTKHKSNPNHGFHFKFHCQHYRLKQPKRTVRQCLLRRKSYSVGLFMPIELFYKGRRVTILWFKMLDLPLMTKNGHFIMNGVTRVILNQVVRSPGVYFQKTLKAPGKTLFNADFIAQRGTWLRLEANEKEKKVWAKLKYCPKLPIVPFLRCFGLQPKVLNVYLDCLRNPRFTRQNGTSAQRESSLDEALNGTNAKIFSKLIGLGLTRSRSAKKSRKKTQLHHAQPLNPLAYGITGQKESFHAFASTLPVNHFLSNQYFLEKIYRRFLKRKFWNPKTYDLSSNGRWKLNKTLGLRIGLKQTTLTATDVLFGVLYLLQCVNGTKAFSDIDDLQNRNVKPVSTLLQNQLAAGLFQFEKTVMETCFDSGPIRKSKKFKNAAFASKAKKLVTIKTGYNAYQTEQQKTFEKLKYGVNLTPHYYKKDKKKKDYPLSDKAILKTWLSRLNSREINRSFRTFFGTNPLSQFLDETNALAELTHKRRLSSLGLGGVTRETATMAVRSIHPTHYGRICPIETPEGQNAGLVNSLTTYGHLNANGLIETPFLKTYKGYVMTDQNPIGLSSVQEKALNIASGDLPRTIYQFLPKQEVALRQYRDYKKLGREQVDIVAVTPVQMISVGTSLIPFLEHNDGNRALMGSNMQRQAVSTLHASRPIVGTGFESRTVANVGTSLQAESAGLIAYVDSQRINVYHPLRRYGSVFNADFQANTLTFSKTHKPIQNGRRFKRLSKTKLNHDSNPINLHHNLVSTGSKTKHKTQTIRKQSVTTTKTKVKSKAQKIIKRQSAKIKAKSQAQTISKPFRNGHFQGQVMRQIMMTKLKKNPSLLNKEKAKTASKDRKEQTYLEKMYITTPFFRAQSSLTIGLKKNHLKRDYVNVAKLVHFKGSINQPFKANKQLSSKRLFESLLCLRFNQTTQKSMVSTKAKIKTGLTKKSMFGFLCYDRKSGLMTHQLNQAFQHRFDHSHGNDFRLIKPTLSHVTKRYDYGFVHELAHSNLNLNQTNTCIFDASYARLGHAFNASNHEPDLEAIADNAQPVKRRSKHVPYIYQPKVRTAEANNYALTKFANLKAKVFNFSALPLNPFEVCYSPLPSPFQKPVNSPLNPFDKRPFQTKGQTKKWHCQTYFLEPINRSNQETYRIQRPRVKPGQWVQQGDLLAENVSSCHGELSVGQNLFVGYTPWEGYNFEDAVLISQRLVSNDIMTSLHIERYEIRTRDTIFGYEEITRNALPIHHWDPSWLQLDESGIVKLGSWVKKGDTLVGRMTPVQEKPFSNYERLLFSVLQRNDHGWRETSLVLSHGEGMVIHIEKSRRVVAKPFDDTCLSDGIAKDKFINRLKQPYGYPEKQTQSNFRKNRFKSNAKQTQSKLCLIEPVLSLDIQPNLRKVIYALKKAKQHGFYAGSFAFSTYEAIFGFDKQPLTKPCQNKNRVKAPYIRNPWFKIDQSRLKLNTLVNPSRPYDDFSKTFKKPLKSVPNRFKDRLEYDRVFVYVAHKRRIQIGDKISGRHGNKGIVSRILPSQDMPYLPDGTPLDVVLNPLGVPSRMNVGQIFECLLGLAGAYLNQNYKLQPFDEVYGCEASRSLVYSKLYEARLKTQQNWLFDPNFPGKVRLFDGRTGQCFEQPVTVGKAYILKLIHMVDEKIHARLTGPYSLITQQPLRGRAKNGGQRVGEMEVWALEGFGASYTLQEILTFKSDDVLGRDLALKSIQGATPFSYGVPECFRVLTRELNGLCLHLNIIRPRKHKPKSF